MSVDSLRKIRNNWQSDSSFQTQINRSLDSIGFTEDYVLHSISKRYEKSLPRKSKQIKDNQWGMIEFDWRAMRLIDSPIIQRLRYIKQLGFSYLTYPSAEHSRFSHSIGIGHVVSNFINAINKRANEADTTGRLKYVPISSIPDLSSQDLIHAALLHDIGHLPYSHVTEKIISSQSSRCAAGEKPVDEILLDVAGLSSAGPVIKKCLESNGFNNFRGLNCAEEIDAHEWSAELERCPISLTIS
jgi:deoxynucleoside triphosphate triphosphohydrolase SAMHD1